MSTVVGSYEAKTHLPRLLALVAKGETVTITRHGVPVARLVPPDDERRADLRQVVDEWRAYRDRRNLTLDDDTTIREMIEHGRR